MEKYVPDIYQKSIYTIDYSKLLNRGIKCLLFDLDNTIVPPRSREKSTKAKDLIISLKQKGFKVIIVSNSPKRRVSVYKKFLNVEGVYFACKPFPKKLKRVIKENGYDITEVAIIGDQLLTDIAGGNQIGITTILINPITNKDHILSLLNRFMERRKIKKLGDLGLFYKGRYYE